MKSLIFNRGEILPILNVLNRITNNDTVCFDNNKAIIFEVKGDRVFLKGMNVLTIGFFSIKNKNGFFDEGFTFSVSPNEFINIIKRINSDKIKIEIDDFENIWVYLDDVSNEKINIERLDNNKINKSIFNWYGEKLNEVPFKEEVKDISSLSESLKTLILLNDMALGSREKAFLMKDRKAIFNFLYIKGFVNFDFPDCILNGEGVLLLNDLLKIPGNSFKVRLYENNIIDFENTGDNSFVVRTFCGEFFEKESVLDLVKKIILSNEKKIILNKEKITMLSDLYYSLGFSQFNFNFFSYEEGEVFLEIENKSGICSQFKIGEGYLKDKKNISVFLLQKILKVGGEEFLFFNMDEMDYFYLGGVYFIL